MTESVLPVCKPRNTRLKTAFFSFLYLLFLLAVVEAGLRIQQKAGPYYDLEFSKWSLELLSGDLNHGPSPKEDYDADGIQRSGLRPSSYPAGTKPFSILFMGDSFIQGYGPSDNLPQHVWEYFQTTELKTAPLLLLNAGYSSYSPSIFIPQAKKLVPARKPGMVVVDIDETDFLDDAATYRQLTLRDAEGKIVRVLPSPVYSAKVRKMVSLKNRSFYLQRLLEMWWHNGIYLYFFHKAYKKNTKPSITHTRWRNRTAVFP